MAKDRRARLGEDVVVPTLRDRDSTTVVESASPLFNARGIPIAHEVSKAVRLERDHYERLRQAEATGKVVQDLPVNLIRFAPFVNRSDYYFSSERYRQLRDSIKASGKLDTPIKVRPVEEGGSSYQYEVVFGYTRLRIARDLGWEKIPATVERVSDQELILAKFRENADREDLSVYDQARTARELLEAGFSGDRKQMMAAVNRSNQWISHQLTIASIPAEIMAAYPLLYQAGYDDLAELGRACKSDEHSQRLLAERDTIHTDNPAVLVRKLCRLLQEASETLASETAEVFRVMDPQGQLLAECKKLSKGGRTLRFTAEKGAFADYVMSQLEHLYTEYHSSK